MAVELIQAPPHWSGLSTDRRPNQSGSPIPGLGSTFTCVDTGDVDVWNGRQWRATVQAHEPIVRILESILEEQRATREAVEALQVQLAS